MLDERRLARPVLAEDGDRLAGFDGQRNAADGLDAARVAVDEVVERRRERGRARGTEPSPTSGERRVAEATRRRAAVEPRAPRDATTAPPGPAAIAASSNASDGGSPAALREPDERRRGCSARCLGRRERRARDVEGDRPASLEDEAPVHPAEDARVVLGAQDRGPGARQLVEQVRDRHGPRRVELGGRLVEDEDGRAHRDDARDGDPLLLAAGQGERLAVGEMADRQARQRRVDPRVHLRARDAEVLEPEGELLADRQLRGGQLVGRRREDDADPAEQRSRGGGHRVLPLDDDPAVHLRADHPRDEPGRRECQGRLARAGPPGHADALARRDRHADTPEARFPPARITDGQVRDEQRRIAGARRYFGWSAVRHRGAIPSATSTMPTAVTRMSRRSHRSSGGSATVR